MLRVLNYPYAETDVKVLDRYGNLRGTLHLQQGENTLPITPYGCHLKDSLGNVFFIYAGEGVLEFSDALKHYDFSALEPMLVELFLDGQTPFQDGIKEWLAVYDLNIQKGREYLLPNGFKQIENAILKDFKWQ